jgi:hypothetical protein
MYRGLLSTGLTFGYPKASYRQAAATPRTPAIEPGRIGMAHDIELDPKDKKCKSPD